MLKLADFERRPRDWNNHSAGGRPLGKPSGRPPAQGTDELEVCDGQILSSLVAGRTCERADNHLLAHARL